jgi:hypothetical protein
MTRALRGSLRRAVALLLLLAAAGLTFGAPFHAKHDTGADPAHQRACLVVAWTKAVQAAAVTPPLGLAPLSAVRRECVPDPRPQTPVLVSPAPSARAPPTS